MADFKIISKVGSIAGGSTPTPATLNSLVLSEISRTADPATRLEYVKLAIKPSMSSSVPTATTVWLSKDNGVTWEWINVYVMYDGVTITIDTLVPGTTQLWKVAAKVGAIDRTSILPGVTVPSNIISVAGLPIASTTAVTGATVPAAVADSDKDGRQWAYIPPVTYTDPSLVTQGTFFVRVTVQCVDASGNPAPWVKTGAMIGGNEVPHDGTQVTGGVHQTQGLLLDYSPAGSPYTYIRFRIYVANRNSQDDGDFADPTTNVLQNCWPGGADHYDVNIGSLPSGTLNAQRILESTLNNQLRQTPSGLGLNTRTLGNILLNGDFDSGVMRPWINLLGPEIGIETNASFSDTSASYWKDSMRPYGGIRQSNIGVRGGQYYQASARVNAGFGTVTGTAFINLVFQDASGADIPGTNNTLALSSGMGWQDLSVGVVAPVGASTVFVQVQMAGNAAGTGYWYIDSVYLKMLDPIDLGLTRNASGTTSIKNGRGKAFDSSGALVDSTQDDGNILVNPSFEFGVAEWHIDHYHAGLEVALIDNQPAHQRTGQNYLKILTSAIGQTNLYQFAPTKPSTKYTVSCWVKNLGTDGTVTLLAYYHKPDGTVSSILLGEGIVSRSGSTGGVYVQLVGNVTIPADAQDIQPVLAVQNCTNYWLVDDFSVRLAVATGPGLDLTSTGKVQVKVSGPLYTDVADNINFKASSDFVVSGGVLTQNIVDLAKAANFSTEFIKQGGLLTMNALGVNKLVAGDALFAGQATFAMNGGGKVTLSSGGLTLADSNSSPTATVTVNSSGISLSRGSNLVTLNSAGISVTNGTGSVTINASGVTIANGNLSCTTNGLVTSVNNQTIGSVMAGFACRNSSDTQCTAIAPQYIRLSSGSGVSATNNIILSGILGSITVYNGNSAQMCVLSSVGNGGRLDLYSGLVSPSLMITLDGVNGFININGQTVLGGRKAGPGVPSFASLANAQTWCQSLLTALQSHGLVT